MPDDETVADLHNRFRSDGGFSLNRVPSTPIGITALIEAPHSVAAPGVRGWWACRQPGSTSSEVRSRRSGTLGHAVIETFVHPSWAVTARRGWLR